MMLMKKLLSLKNLVLLLACLSFAFIASAYDYEANGLYYNRLDDGSVEVTYKTTSYNSYSGSIVIPSEMPYQGFYQTVYFPVTGIGRFAFCDCTNLTSISIPTSVTYVGESAFSECTSLTTVTVPYSVTRIDYNAFGDCDNLKTAYIGSGVTYIGSYGFDSPLTRVEVYPYTPPTINNSNAFKTSTYNDAILIVPEGRVSAYKSATYWSNFAHIRSRNAVPINSTNFPDANFRAALASLYPDGYISDIASITYLNVAYKGITNLKGIELFTGLQTLYCYNNSISSLDLSSNTNLTYLSCYGNNMTSLNVNKCKKLTYLDCAPNSLTSLDLSNLTALEKLICYSNKLTSLTLASSTPNLSIVKCYDNKFTSLSLYDCPSLTNIDAKNCTSLKYLYCYRNALTALNISGNTALEELYCFENANLSTITGLNDCTAITYIDCDDCAITDLSAVNNMTKLNRLYCRYNKLTTLTLTNKSYLVCVRASGNTSMTTANVRSNSNMTELTISGCTALTELKCYNNDLTILDVAGNTALKKLECYYNYNLASIYDLADCKAITYLDCEDCKISNLSAVSGMTNIELLWARNNQLTSLTVTDKSKLGTLRVSGNTSLTSLKCNSNALTSLDVTNCTALKTLNCSSNSSLSSISGLTSCTALTSFNCNDCNFSTLNVSALTKLTNLECRRNQLSTLNVTPLTALAYLNCRGNQLTSLNVSSKTSLTELYCYDNLLTSLNVQGCSSLLHINCQNNKLTSLYLQGCSALQYIYCYKNQISGSGMTTLVGSLPTRTSSSPGNLYAIYNTGESNEITSQQLVAANNKYWNVKRYNGSEWENMVATGLRGDVNGDGEVNISDVSTLMNVTLGIAAMNSSCDVNGDGNVNITDVTLLITYVLTETWPD